MTKMFVVLTAAACAALVAFQFADMPLPSTIAKLIASTSFVALAVTNGALSSLYGRLILTGLVFSWFGDFFLTGEAQPMFLAGLVAFLLGHLAYVSAFVTHGYERSWVIVAAIPLTIIAIGVWTWLEPGTPDELSIPVRAYIAVITLMVIFAYGTRGRGGSWYIIAGATLFFLSDLSVAAMRLMETELATFALGLPAYFAAQVCLALSVKAPPR